MRRHDHRAAMRCCSLLWYLALAQTALAFENKNVDGVTWNWTYEGDILPNNSDATPPWEVTGIDLSTDRSVLTIRKSTYLEISGEVRKPKSEWIGSAPASTIEFRMRVTKQTDLFGSGFCVASDKGRADLKMRFHSVQFILGDNTEPFKMDTTEFHVYRLTFENGAASVTMKLYIDNEKTPALVNHDAHPIAPAMPMFVHGYSQDIGGTSEWDYIRWTNEGAFAPLQKPPP